MLTVFFVFKQYNLRGVEMSGENLLNPKACAVAGCGIKVKCRGYCNGHYDRLRMKGSVLEHIPLQVRFPFGEVCSVIGCGRKHKSRGLCDAHSQRLKKHGSIMPDKPLRDYLTTHCTIEGCIHKKKGRGLCNKHSLKLKKYGNPLEGYEVKSTPALGSRQIDKTGYVLLYVKGNKKQGRYVREHRFVMEQILERNLTKDEFVHHKNGDRQDNRPENLELWTKHHPTGARVKDLLLWAREILAKYKDEESKL
jgi:hypothetical protein